MINYHRSAFGLNLLFRIHGSAVYRAFLPALIAVFVFLILRLHVNEDRGQPEEQTLEHPYVIGVVVGGITFLIVFRASSSYARYWEACSSVYQMQSKWMDATVHTACYHMQCHHYDHIKPPSYFDYPQLDAQFLTRDRERVRPTASGKGTEGIMNAKRALQRSINAVTRSSSLPKSSTHSSDDDDSQFHNNSEAAPLDNSLRTRLSKAGSFTRPKLKQQASNIFETAAAVQERRRITGRTSFSIRKRKNSNNKNSATTENSNHDSSRSTHEGVPHFLSGLGRLDGNWGPLFDDGKSTFQDPKNPYQRPDLGFASYQGGRTPPVFLQELAHLASLMTAVALSTLRNDIDGSESPLDFYRIGSPWPKVDPEDIPELYKTPSQRFWANLKFFVGMGRTAEERTRYNAARPLSVLGGVSDNEIAFLQMARGPYAKTQLCWNWLSEFITREHLAGSLGDVGPPIISRVVQFLGDGMVSYNHARKIMFIPFPFPHAQLSAAYVLVMIPMIAYMMDQYCYYTWVGSTLTFLSVACLSAIHEVARELENPFRNVPNELPVCTLMAEFNEALLTMYAGYHPDFFWEVPDDGSVCTKDSRTSKSSGVHSNKRTNTNKGRDDVLKYSLVLEGFGGGAYSGSSHGSGMDSTSDLEDSMLFRLNSNGGTMQHWSERSEENSTSSSRGDDKEEQQREDEDVIVASPTNDEGNSPTDGNKDQHPTPTRESMQKLSAMDTDANLDTTVHTDNTKSKTSLAAAADKGTELATSPQQDSGEVDQLRLIVKQQGKMMEQMLQEQARLNKMIELVLSQNQNQPKLTQLQEDARSLGSASTADA